MPFNSEQIAPLITYLNTITRELEEVTLSDAQREIKKSKQKTVLKLLNNQPLKQSSGDIENLNNGRLSVLLKEITKTSSIDKALTALGMQKTDIEPMKIQDPTGVNRTWWSKDTEYIASSKVFQTVQKKQDKNTDTNTDVVSTKTYSLPKFTNNTEDLIRKIKAFSIAGYSQEHSTSIILTKLTAREPLSDVMRKHLKEIPSLIDQIKEYDKANNQLCDDAYYNKNIIINRLIRPLQPVDKLLLQTMIIEQLAGYDENKDSSSYLHEKKKENTKKEKISALEKLRDAPETLTTKDKTALKKGKSLTIIKELLKAHENHLNYPHSEAYYDEAPLEKILQILDNQSLNDQTFVFKGHKAQLNNDDVHLFIEKLGSFNIIRRHSFFIDEKTNDMFFQTKGTDFYVKKAPNGDLALFFKSGNIVAATEANAETTFLDIEELEKIRANPDNFILYCTPVQAPENSKIRMVLKTLGIERVYRIHTDQFLGFYRKNTNFRQDGNNLYKNDKLIAVFNEKEKTLNPIIDQATTQEKASDVIVIKKVDESAEAYIYEKIIGKINTCAAAIYLEIKTVTTNQLFFNLRTGKNLKGIEVQYIDELRKAPALREIFSTNTAPNNIPEKAEDDKEFITFLETCGYENVEQSFKDGGLISILRKPAVFNTNITPETSEISNQTSNKKTSLFQGFFFRSIWDTSSTATKNIDNDQKEDPKVTGKDLFIKTVAIDDEEAFIEEKPMKEKSKISKGFSSSANPVGVYGSSPNPERKSNDVEVELEMRSSGTTSPTG